MPKILPSQVVSAIDSMFGSNRNELDSRAIAHTYRAEVHALLGLLDEIPSELVDLPSADYLEFSRCRAILATSLALWNVGDTRPARDVGGEDILPKLRFQQAAKDRIISPDVVRAAAPDVILASWCGKKVVADKIKKRPGWSEIPAVRNDRIIEIKSPLILQPGPAALTDGLDTIVAALWPAITDASS